MSRIRILAISAASIFAALSCAPAQAQIPFSVRVQQPTGAANVPDGGTVAFNADGIGKPSEALLTVTYRGSTSATGASSAVVNSIELTGSNDFMLLGLPDPTQVLQPGQVFSFTITYRPTTSARASGSIRFGYTETPPPPTTGTATPRTGSFTVNLTGVVPEFFFTIVPQGGNSTPLLPGGTIQFPATLVNEASTALLVVGNRGSGSGVVTLLTVTGTAFTVAGTVSPPATIDPGRDIRFTIRYSPTVVETSTGAVRVELSDRAVIFNLQGSSTGSTFSYDVIQDSTIIAVLPGQTISLADALVGEKSSVVVRVRNTGNADGRVAAIAAQGTGYTVSETPFLPQLVTPGSSFTFTVNFNPTAPGRVPGRLRVGTDEFNLTGNGLGASLIFGYAAGSVTTPVVANGSVIFPPVVVGGNSSVRFAVTNNGTAPGAINSVSVVTTGTQFTLASLPILPVNIGPGETVSFTATFAPTTVGTVTGTLKIDSLNFTLSGAGTQPAALPEYTFNGASGSQDPGQQAAIGLSLASGYSLPLSGTLTLAFNSDVFANDPAVQFASGGRTVNFAIPAGSRDAVFANNATTMRLQTGTVAGSITIAPSFSTDGGINLTPANPPPLNLTVPPSAPRLLSVQLTGKTASGFSLLVTGFATSRAITQIDLQFTPLAGENVSTTRLSLNVEPSFVAWYQNAASVPFGSLFTATLPFTLAGDVKNVTNVIDTLQSAQVTLINRQGSSAPRSVDLK